MSTEELDASLEILLDTLPDEHEGPQRRKYSLTRHDAKLIANMIQVAVTNQGCSIGLTTQQMAAIKDIAPGTFRDMRDMVKERRRVLNAIGLMTLGILGWLGKWIFETVDWHKVWSVFHK
jgi:galactokinase